MTLTYSFAIITPMLNKKKLSLIIPCRNEETALYSMLQKLPAYIDEVIVVDNDSSDNTAAVAKAFGAKVFIEKRNVDGVGYGYAHQTGMKNATGDIIVALDGDDTYPLEAIKDIVTYMEKSNADFVSCSRFPLDNPRAISRTRQLGVKVLNLQVSLLYGIQIQDILSGMWVMKKSCIGKLAVHRGEWNFSPEIKLAALCHPNIHFSEYHIPHTIRQFGMSKQNIWKTGTEHLLYIIKRRFTVDKVDRKQQVKYAADRISSLAQSFTTYFF